MNNDNSGTMYLGGFIVVIVVIGVCLKALHKIFIELGHTFDAFGSMAASFIAMAWQMILALGLVTAGIGCVVGAIYFTYRYYQMVKQGTDIQNHVARTLEGFRSELGLLLEEHGQKYDERLIDLDLKIYDIKDKQALLLTPPVPASEATVPPNMDNEATSTTDTTTSPSGVSNPF